ncbi:hypothetical protein D3C78_663230 [compost metagenome]
MLGQRQVLGRHEAAAQQVQHEHHDLQGQQPRHGLPTRPVHDQRGDDERQRAEHAHALDPERARHVGGVAAQGGDGDRGHGVAQYQGGGNHVDQRFPGRERQGPEHRQAKGQPQRRARDAGLGVDTGEVLEEGAGLRPAIDHARGGVHVDVAAAAGRDHRVGHHQVSQPAHTQGQGDVAVGQGQFLGHCGPAVAQHFGRHAAEEGQLQQGVDRGGQQYREDQRDGDGALRVLHLAGHRNDRRQAQVGEDDAAGRYRHFNAGQTERGKALDLEVFRLEEGEQHADHQQRHDELEHADQVVGLGEGFHAAVVEEEEQSQQGELHQPAEHGRVAGAGLGQPGEPGGGVLARSDHFDGDQAGKGDQGDETHQVAQQRAVGVHRVAHHTPGTRQGSAQFAIDDAQQQYGEAAKEPGQDAGRAGDGRDVAGGEQPAGAEDGA